MADVFFWSTHWDGTGFTPGRTHTWRLFHSDWDDRSIKHLDMQVNITAHPLGDFKSLDPPAEVTVENVRSRILEDWTRRMFFTVRNSGPSQVYAYRVSVTFITR